MTDLLADTTAIVTGASSGIGKGIATTLAEQGANVAIAARSDQTERVAEEIGERALPVRLDVTDEEAVKRGIERTVNAFGGLDCVVNNAGLAGPIELVEDIGLGEWEETMAVNVNGPFLMVKHAVPHLRESDRASVVTISSITGKRPAKRRTPYATSKIAVIGLTRTLALELGEDDITVNAICPGATDSPRITGFIENRMEGTDLSYEEAKQDLGLVDNALGSLVEIDDTAELVAFLASEAGRHITGQDINVDAGTIWY